MKVMFSKKWISSMSFYIALLLLLFVFLNITISSLLFLVHISIGPGQFIVASLCTLLTGLFLLRKQGTTVVIGVLSLVIALVAATLFITSVTSDDTVDAHGYHETAVGAMRYGWNPVYEHIADFNNSDKPPFKIEGTYYQKWDDHYPKAHWIFGANVYSVTNNIETGRSMVILITLVLFFLVLHYALVRFSMALSLVLALIAALNPIGIMQIFSYYNDGMIGNLLFIMVLPLTMLFDRKYTKFSWPHYTLIGMAMALVMNLKFTGLLYAAVFCFAYLAYAIFVKHHRRAIRPLLITGFVGVFVGVFLIGLSTYPKNFIEKGTPLYPLMGGGSATDIITANEPYTFHNMSNLKKLFIANFSATDNISASTGRDPNIKAPFTFDTNELSYLSYVDPRIGGYGVWFGGILILSIFWLIYAIGSLVVKKQWSNMWLLLLPLIPTSLLLVFVSEAWWARYAPQMFIIPAVALISLLLVGRKNLANVLIFVLLFNSILTLSLQITGQKSGLSYKDSEMKEVDALLENGKYTPKLYLGDFNGLAYRYYERYGKVVTVPEKPNVEMSNSLTLAKGIIVYR